MCMCAQALLYVPERAGKQPPIHTLIVDYSSVYGTDCPAVDTIIMRPVCREYCHCH